MKIVKETTVNAVVGSGEKTLALTVRLDAEGNATEVHMQCPFFPRPGAPEQVGIISCSGETLARVAASVESIEREHAHRYIGRGICADHGYYDSNASKYSCPKCEAEKGELE